MQGGLIDQVFQVRAGKPRRAPGQDFQINIVRQRSLAGMHRQDTFASTKVRVGNNNLTVKTAGTEQGRIKHVRPVGRGNEDNALIGFKTVHLNQHGVQGLFPFIVAAAKTGSTLAADSVNLVNKNQAGSVAFALDKQVSHLRGANSDKNFYKI